MSSGTSELHHRRRRLSAYPMHQSQLIRPFATCSASPSPGNPDFHFLPTRKPPFWALNHTLLQHTLAFASTFLFFPQSTNSSRSVYPEPLSHKHTAHSWNPRMEPLLRKPAGNPTTLSSKHRRSTLCYSTAEPPY